MAIFKPLTDLKDTTGICEFCQEHFEPIFITRNGEPELVIMNADFSTIISGSVMQMANWTLPKNSLCQ